MERVTLEGTVERITYYSAEDGYSVIRLAATSPLTFWSGVDENGLVTVVGNLPDVMPGESLELEGQWVTHSSYGRQFRAENVRRVTPATVEGIRRYLGSGLIRGIGPRLAERIVDRFGLDTLDVLDRDPERLYEVEGLGQHRVRSITRAWLEQQEIKQVMLFLQSHGVSTSLAVKIYKTYGDDAIRQVESDPYRLARDVHGIGFITADKIARDLGLAHNHPARLEAGLVYSLNNAADEGHVYLPEDVLVEAAAGLLDVPAADVEAAVDRAAHNELVKIDTLPAENPAEGEPATFRAVYLPPFYHAEVGAARVLRNLVESPQSYLDNSGLIDWPALIADAASAADAPLTAQQQAAVLTALTHKVSILTGGPGTGKTTTLRALIHVLGREGYTFALASPTGRAAKRLSEATGQPARTIHRMLGYSPQQGFVHNEEEPLPVDFVIVDEVSMLDGFLAYSLFRAIHPRTHLLLVGDVDQLPSVGAGDVLRDLIGSGTVPVTRLDTIFRQAAGSYIISNAHRINRGKVPLFSEEAQDFFLFNLGDDADRVAEMVVDVVQNRIPDRFGLHPLDDTQVLVPMYRGRAGVSSLNQALQAALNPPGRPAERVLGGRVFRVGDKVLQTSNNYDKEVFNGDVGRIRAFNFTEQSVTVQFEDRQVLYDFTEVPDLMHAYAISVHRSQGSEYPAVVMPVVTQHYMLLQRNLLYTAVTRAKQLVVLVGSKKAISIAVNNDAVSRRHTALALRLREALDTAEPLL
ncbi:MAG TPA: ATP-dependent RecD-like DNA helicase [Aggregatilineales bacterium]|nr:ATP-dependent RecD-like DNA helicase [Aggregatilineales bacterium]